MASRQITSNTPLLSQPITTSPDKSLENLSSDTSNLSLNTSTIITYSEDVSSEEASCEAPQKRKNSTSSAAVGHIICVLLIGSFIANADGSLLFATHPIIASEFNALHDSSWLMTSFALGQAATQPLYGKMSDIFGRKILLMFAYVLFAAGIALVGMGQSMPMLIVGRAISGAGCSGMTSIVSILITDLVPLRDIATWRSYVNIVSTTGRSIGGPLGGLLADTVGWRWSFLGQVPLLAIAVALVGMTLPSHVHHQQDDEVQTRKLARIDFIGATFMTLGILSLLFPLEIGGDRIPWSSPIIISLLIAASIFALLFLATEGWIAKEPIIPLPLLRHRDILASNCVASLQCAAQTGLMFAVPLYFQVTSRASNSVAGAHLVPAVVGNTIGGILSGIIINRTGRYKFLVFVATLAASCGYLLLIARWHGHTNWLESLYIFPCGFGMGVMQSSVFVSVQAAIDSSYSAIAASMLYSSISIGNLAGLAGASAVLQQILRDDLNWRLKKAGFEGETKWDIIQHAVSDVHYIDEAEPSVVEAVTGAYVKALSWTHVFSLACSLSAFIASLFLRQHSLQ